MNWNFGSFLRTLLLALSAPALFALSWLGGLCFGDRPSPRDQRRARLDAFAREAARRNLSMSCRAI